MPCDASESRVRRKQRLGDQRTSCQNRGDQALCVDGQLKCIIATG
jgi:hypothetical protein